MHILGLILSGSSPGPYLQYVKKAAEISPRMAWLGHWMEVTASPLKWKFLQHYPGDKEKGHCAERAQRVNVCILDYPENGLKPEAKKYDQSGTLRAALKDSDTKHSRLVIIEDLSRDVIEGRSLFQDSPSIPANRPL